MCTLIQEALHWMTTPADELPACRDGIMEFVMLTEQIKASRCKQSSIKPSNIELSPQRRERLRCQLNMPSFAHIWLALRSNGQISVTAISEVQNFCGFCFLVPYLLYKSGFRMSIAYIFIKLWTGKFFGLLARSSDSIGGPGKPPDNLPG